MCESVDETVEKKGISLSVSVSKWAKSQEESTSAPEDLSADRVRGIIQILIMVF